MGFRAPREASAAVRRWLPGGHRALRGTFARGQLADLVPHLLPQISRPANPDAGLIAFDRSLAPLQGGGRPSSLLRQNPELVALTALRPGAAPPPAASRL